MNATDRSIALNGLPGPQAPAHAALDVPDWPQGWTVDIVGCGSAGGRAARHLLALGVPAEAIGGYDTAGNGTGPLPLWPAALRTPTLPGVVPGRPLPQLLLLCVPPSSRSAWMDEVRRSGQGRVRAVHLEKPVAYSAEGARSVHDWARDVAVGGVRVQTGYCWRHHPLAARLQAWVAARTGGLRGVVARAMVTFDRRTWPGAASGSYGDLLADGSHELELLRMALGPGVVVSAYRHENGWFVRGCAVATVVVEHHSGAVTLYEVHDGAATSRAVSLHTMDGTSSSLSWRTRHITLEDGAGALAEDGRVLPEWAPPGWQLDHMYRDQYAALLRLAVRGEPAPGGLQEALDVGRWCGEAYAVAQRARTPTPISPARTDHDDQDQRLGAAVRAALGHVADVLHNHRHR